MKARLKNIVIVICEIFIVTFCYYFIKAKYYKYALIMITFEIGYIVFCINYFITLKNPKKAYDIKIKSYLKIYAAVLASNKDYPNIKNRDIISLENMEDLINIQIELRKPIIYKKEKDTCTFILLDEHEAYIYIEKYNKDLITPIEIEIENIKNNNQKIDASVFDKIEQPTIIKLPNMKSYKVSPIEETNKA